MFVLNVKYFINNMNKITKNLKKKIKKFVLLKMIDEFIPKAEKRKFYKTFIDVFLRADTETRLIYIKEMDKRIERG